MKRKAPSGTFQKALDKTTAGKTGHRPTLPGRCQPSTIGPAGLNYRIRNGNGCGPRGIGARKIISSKNIDNCNSFKSHRIQGNNGDQTARPISTGQLHMSPRFHLPPIYPVVYRGPYLLKQWRFSSWGALHAYMLSAFIAPGRSYPASAPGGTTGTPAVRPTRSSRTRVSPPQNLCARRG